MYGAQSSSELRGDYSKARADFTVDQDLAAYSDTDRRVWRRLVERQSSVIRRHAAREFIDGLRLLGHDTRIPDLERVSDLLQSFTGWRLVAVPGFIPDDAFFRHLAARRFPVCVWVRTPQEMDYLVEPDLFHDFFGHVPMLLQPAFADYLALYGQIGLKAAEAGVLPRLARLYWYTVEFGLIDTEEGLKAYGAGMLSSKTETVYSVTSPKPRRLWFDLTRVMRTRYMIDDFQKTYFVLPNFAALFDVVTTDFAPLYRQLQGLSDIDADEIAAGDRLYRFGASGCSSGAA